MKHITLIFILLLFALPATAQDQVTTVTGTARDYSLQVMPDHPYTIKEVRRGGYIIPIRDVTGYTDSVGVLTFEVPRSNFTTFDTTKVHLVLNAPQYWNNGRGVWLIIPDASTAELSTLPPAQYLGPPGFAVVVPSDLPYGDSIAIADSLARTALDSASAARQDLLIAIAQLQAQLDTAGAATRSVIENDIAALYAQLSAVSGQIAALTADLAALGARVDTVGAAERAVIEAHNAQQDGSIAGVISDNLAQEDSIALRRLEIDELQQEQDAQDIAIADAGKWVQYDAVGTYKVAAPKWTPTPGDTLVAEIDNAGNARFAGSVNATGEITSSAGISFGGGKRIYENIGDIGFNDRLRIPSAFVGWNNGITFGEAGTAASIAGQTGSMDMIFKSNGIERGRLLQGGGWTFGTPTTNYFNANFGGTVHIDSSLIARKTLIAPRVVYDTTDMTVSDSVAYTVTSMRKPFIGNVGGWGTNSETFDERLGWIEIEFNVNKDLGDGTSPSPMRFQLIPDSANGVRFVFAEWFVWSGYRYSESYVTLNPGNIGYINMDGAALRSGGTGRNAEFKAYKIGSEWGAMDCYFYSGNRSHQHTARIRLYFTVDLSFPVPSDWWVKLADF